MSTPFLELKKEARKFIDIKKLFPNSAIDLRKKLTPYQTRKIKQSIAEVKQFGGGKINQFVVMRAGRAKYMRDNGLPVWLRGIFLPGGEKINRDLHYIKNEVRYTRGGAARARTELDTSGDEQVLLKSADKILKNRKRRTTALTANGFVIGSAQNMRTNELIKKEAVHIFLKYSTMYENEEFREGKYKTTKAAHPSDWGTGL